MQLLRNYEFSDFQRHFDSDKRENGSFDAEGGLCANLAVEHLERVSNDAHAGIQDARAGTELDGGNGLDVKRLEMRVVPEIVRYVQYSRQQR